MWHQWFNPNFMKLRESFLCAKKTKIMTFFQQFLLFWVSPFHHSREYLDALNRSVALLSMEGQKALGCHQKYHNLCSEDERMSFGFGTTWGWVIKDRIFLFEWTIPLKKILVYCIIISLWHANIIIQCKLAFTICITWLYVVSWNALGCNCSVGLVDLLSAGLAGDLI